MSTIDLNKETFLNKFYEDKIDVFVFVEGQSDLPESKYLRVENKVFYFDVGSNRRGVYLRVSEVHSSVTLTFPASHCLQLELIWSHVKISVDIVLDKIYNNSFMSKANFLVKVMRVRSG